MPFTLGGTAENAKPCRAGEALERGNAFFDHVAEVDQAVHADQLVATRAGPRFFLTSSQFATL